MKLKSFLMSVAVATGMMGSGVLYANDLSAGVLFQGAKGSAASDDYFCVSAILKIEEKYVIEGDTVSEAELEEYGNLNPDDYIVIQDTVSKSVALTVEKKTDGAPAIELEYSFDKEDWKALAIGNQISFKDKVYLRAKQSNPSMEGYRFTLKGESCSLSGNLMSLLDPAMQLDVVPDGAFKNLFQQISALVHAQSLKLPTQKLGVGCYEGLFRRCMKLKTAPALPAMELAKGCYSGMFQNCMALLSAPELPATELADSCYAGMFQSCSTLTFVSELPATVLSKNCYKEMFRGCSKLKNVPELVATELVEGCYMNMFYGCKLLNKVIAHFDNWEVKDATTGWLTNVAAQGGFRYNGSANIERSANTVPAGWDINPDYFCLTVEEEGAKMFIIKNDKSENIALQYSMDGFNWQDYSFKMVLTFGKDKKIYWRAKNVNANLDGIQFYTFGYARFTASGNIMSLLDSAMQQTQVPARAFKGLFENCQGLTQAPELPFTELGDSCYFEMFKDCTALTTAPELPATELTTSCYQSMFEWCKKLVNVPDFPAAQMGRYSCYKMFSFCKSLENAPALPVTALAPNCCASMFEQCESLTHAPVLPDVELADSCYRSMFWYCKKLNTIYAEFTHALPSVDAVSFFYTAPEGTFYCPEALTKDSNFYYIALETKWKVYSYKTEVQLLDNGYASYASPLDMQIVDGGVAVYATERDFAVYVSEIDSVPANQGVLLKGEPNGIVHLKKLGEVRPAAKGGQADNELYPLVLAYNEVAFAPKQGAVYALVNKGFVLCAQDGVFEGVNGKSLFNESQSYLVLDKVLDAPYLPILTSDDERRTFDVTISDCGYTTLCLPYNARGPEGVTIYSLRSADQSGLHFAHVEAITAKKGYVVAGTPGETYTFTEVFDNHADSKNLLQGVTERTYRTDLLFTHTEFLDYPWILAKDGLFKRYIGDYIPANKAYVDARRIKDALTDINEASAFRIILDEEFEEETTGITALTTDTESAPELYSLDGRRVSQPARGTIYIERGKKLVIVK